MSKVSTHTALLYIREPEVFDGDLPKLIREAAPQIRRMRELGLLSFAEDREEAKEGQAGHRPPPLRNLFQAEMA